MQVLAAHGAYGGDPETDQAQDPSTPTLDRVDEATNVTNRPDTLPQEVNPDLAVEQGDTLTPLVTPTPTAPKDDTISTTTTTTTTTTQLPDNRRSLVQGRKESMATTFLSQLSLHGGPTNGKSRDSDTAFQESTTFQALDSPMNQDPGQINATGQTPKDAAGASPIGLAPHHPIYRASSTPSLSSRWEPGPFSESSDQIDDQGQPSWAGGEGGGRRYRKATGPGTHPSRESQQHGLRTNTVPSTSSKNGPSKREPSSSGLLSALLAIDKDTDARASSSDMGSALTQRNALQKVSSRWLGPLADHVHIRPLLTSGTTHIVKKIFRRPSISRPKHIISHSQPMRTQDPLSASRQTPSRADLQRNARQGRSGEDQRHIFYKGEDVTASCVSLGDNLSQHPFMFTTNHGSPLMISSVLRYNDDRAPNKRRRRRFDREYIQQITKEALTGKKANSFAHLLTQCNALDPEPQESSSASYDPYFLDDPELKTGKNRTVISLACYMGSVIQYTRPSDLKRELNEHFRSRHPTIDPSITLSKIRKVKTDLLAISEELDLEISTAALAYAYFEKLILKGSWKGKESNPLSTEANTSIVTKENRKMIACVCLLLAYKVNEPKTSSGEFATLMKYMTKHMEVSAKDIKENEFHVFSLLEFNLYLPRQEFLPHFEQILYRQDYINVQEYLGEDEFYSVITQPRKSAE
ncbi:CDK5 and ABL1 enzyme substrate 1 [Mortierella sp. GBA39]|nr:CDK5 and ABL1 enzyme substrate 1 [Mortierella sp. GBA39]